MGLESSSAMRELMEVATGRHFDENSSTFDHRALKRSRVGASMGDQEKCLAAAAALEKARNNIPESNTGRRIKVAQAAISRRVTEGKKSTFGHQPRPQAYGRKRWKTHTAALVAAERAELNV